MRFRRLKVRYKELRYLITNMFNSIKMAHIYYIKFIFNTYFHFILTLEQYMYIQIQINLNYF